MKTRAMIVAAISTAACLADPATNVVMTGQQTFEGYLPLSNQVVARNVSLADVTGVFGFAGGASTAVPRFFATTPAFWKADGDAREVQMQFFEPPYIKMVNVRLEQSGADIVARATTARYYRWDDAVSSQDAPHYAKPATPGVYDFFCGDSASRSAGVAESAGSAGYGVHNFGVYSGSRAKTTLGSIENGCVYSIADGGTLEMKGTSDFAGWIDGNGELKIGDSADPLISDSISELQINVAQTVFEKANVHSVTLAVHSVYGSAVGKNISKITVCNSKYESATQRLLQVQFMDGATIKAILLRLTQNGDRVNVVNYNWKYDKNNTHKLGDDATDWANGGEYLIQSATLYAPATHMTVSTTNLAHGAFTVDGAYAKVTSRYTINQGGALSVCNGGYLDVDFSDNETTPDGRAFNTYSGFGGSNDGGYTLLRVLDGSTMSLRGLCVGNKSSLEVSGRSTLALVGSATKYTYVPYFKLADGSQVVTLASPLNALRMGYVAGICKLWSAGTGCTNVIDSNFTFVNENASRTLHVIADADLVFKKDLLMSNASGDSCTIYKYGPAAVEIEGTNAISGTMFLQEGTLRIANDRGLTNDVSFAGGTLEVVSNMSVKVGMLTLASRTVPDAASGGRIVLQPTASLEFSDIGDFAEGAQLTIEGDLSGNVLKMPPLGVARLRSIRVQTEDGLKRVRQDEYGYLHRLRVGTMIVFE